MKLSRKQQITTAATAVLIIILIIYLVNSNIQQAKEVESQALTAYNEAVKLQDEGKLSEAADAFDKLKDQSEGTEIKPEVESRISEITKIKDKLTGEADSLFSDNKIVGSGDNAVNKYREVLTHFPDDEYSKNKLNEISASLEKSADKLLSENQLSKAKDEYTKVLTVIPDSARIEQKIREIESRILESRSTAAELTRSKTQKQAEDHLRKGDEHLAKNEFDRAIGEYRNALEKIPGYPVALEKIKNAEDLKSASEAAALITPDKEEYERYVILDIQGKYFEVISAYEQFIGKYPDSEFAAVAGNRISEINSRADVRAARDIEKNMIRAPAGTFKMGSNNGEGVEKPVHEIKLDRFYINKYEVTQREWKSIMSNNPSAFKGDNLPVEQVNWNEVQEFLKKLSLITGKNYRLPTEAEWEYACRAGAQTEYNFGDRDTNLGDFAWYDKNSDSKTHPVGQRRSNKWGLYDMHGNVGEWCSDMYDPDYYKSSPSANPKGPGLKLQRLIRGGNWENFSFYLRSAYRINGDPEKGNRYTGFRCVRENQIR